MLVKLTQFLKDNILHEKEWHPICAVYTNLILSYSQDDEEEFKEEQNAVARLIYVLHNDDAEEMFKVLCMQQCDLLDLQVLKNCFFFFL